MEIELENYPYLKKYGHNLTEEFRNKSDIQPIIGRDFELRQAIEILSQKFKNNLILTGLPGVGKTALIEGLAQNIVRGEVVENLKDTEIFIVDLASLTSKATDDGGFQSRMKGLIADIEKLDGKVIPFIDEFHTIMGAGDDNGSLDAANILKPALARGTLHMIGATTLWEYHKYLEKDGAITRRFGRVNLLEPTKEDTIEILRGRRRSLEIYHGVTITDAAIKKAVELSMQYITDQYLPDKAIDILDLAGASTKLDIESMPEDLASLQNNIARIKRDIDLETNYKTIGLYKTKLLQLEKNFAQQKKKWDVQRSVLDRFKEKRQEIEHLYSEVRKHDPNNLPDDMIKIRDEIIPQKENELDILKQDYRALNPSINDEISTDTIMKVVANKTKIPLSQLSESEMSRMRGLEKQLHKRLIGQDKAVSSLAYSIKRSRLGLGDPGKPIGTFLFLGPTGVGKTELVKALAENLFGDENAMIRIDMGSFKGKQSVSRLIGSDPGTTGFEDGGALTEFVKNNPYSVVLLDEAEKADPSIWDVMLSVFDDGEITDSSGTLINFKNTVIIMTSNLGSREILRGIDTETGDLTKHTKESVMALLRNDNPETGGRGFKPEFINRLNAIITFLPLTVDEEEQIAVLKLRKLAKQTLRSRNIRLVFSKTRTEVLKENSVPRLNLAYHLAHQLTYEDLKMGGRPIEKLIREEIEDKIVDLLLDEGLPDGSNIYIKVTYPPGSPTYIGSDGQERPQEPIIQMSAVSDEEYDALIIDDPILGVEDYVINTEG